MPNCTGENIFLFKPKAGTGTYDDADYPDAYIKERLDNPNVVTSEDIVRAPNEYMMVLNFWYFNTFVDLKPKDGLYIHSLSEPFNEEMEMSNVRMMNWLRQFGPRYVQSHCSGHMCGADLKELISRIKPKELYPVHTEHPGMFRGLTKTVMVKEGKNYNI